MLITETGKIKFTPDRDSGYVDEELLADNLNELEENWDRYFEIKKMESHESFEIMADFADYQLTLAVSDGANNCQRALLKS